MADTTQNERLESRVVALRSMPLVAVSVTAIPALGLAMHLMHLWIPLFLYVTPALWLVLFVITGWRFSRSSPRSFTRAAILLTSSTPLLVSTYFCLLMHSFSWPFTEFRDLPPSSAAFVLYVTGMLIVIFLPTLLAAALSLLPQLQESRAESRLHSKN